jgi:aspartate/glutamate racemase
MGRVAGIIGGVGPESTLEYYRAIVAGYRAQVRDGSHPRLLINSIDLKNLLDLVAGDRPADVTASRSSRLLKRVRYSRHSSRRTTAGSTRIARRAGT